MADARETSVAFATLLAHALVDNCRDAFAKKPAADVHVTVHITTGAQSQDLKRKRESEGKKWPPFLMKG